MNLISSAYASAAQIAPEAPSQAPNIFLMVIIFFIFYLFLIRPHKKQMKEHQLKINSLKKGDVIVTAGGVMGKIVKLQDADTVHVKISEGVIVQVLKGTISDVSDKKFSPVGEEIKKEKKEKKSKKA